MWLVYGVRLGLVTVWVSGIVCCLYEVWSQEARGKQALKGEISSSFLTSGQHPKPKTLKP